LATLTHSGYSIFVVRGNWPQLHAHLDNEINNDGSWYDSQSIKSRAETYDNNLLKQVNRSQQGFMNIENDDNGLEQAIRESLGNNGNGNGNGNDNDNDNDDSDLAIALSLSNTNNDAKPSKNNDVDDDDAMLKQAISLSIQQNANNSNNANNNNSNNNSNNNDNNNNNNNNNNNKIEKEDMKLPNEPPANDPNRCDIKLCFPNGKRVARGFSIENTLQVVKSFAQLTDPTLKYDRIQFVCSDVIFNSSHLDKSLDDICKQVKSRRIIFNIKNS